MGEKTVLVCLGVNRRAIYFRSEDGVLDVEQLRASILESFSDLINDEDHLVIQVWLHSVFS